MPGDWKQAQMSVFSSSLVTLLHWKWERKITSITAWKHGERWWPFCISVICSCTTCILLIAFPSPTGKFSKWDVIQGETFHRVISFSQMSLNEGSSHQGKILSTRVSLSDGCLQSKFDYSCGAACRANVNSAKDFSTAFHRHSGDAMWGHKVVNISQRDC